MFLYHSLPPQIVNFLCVAVFTWSTLLTTSLSDIDKLMMPMILHYRRSIYLVESFVVSAITTILPISFLEWGIPVAVIFAVALWVYRVNILRHIKSYLDTRSGASRLDRSQKVSFRNSVLSIKNVQARYTVTCMVNDMVFATCWIMIVIVLFSVLCP